MPVYVLVLENDENFCQTLCDTLDVAGYHPVIARAPAKATAHLGRYHFFAAVVDVRMKDENDMHDWSGLVEARHISESKVPVIILSAYDSSEDIERAFTVSMKDLAPRAFISKNSDWSGRLKEVLVEINAEKSHKGSVKEFWAGVLSVLGHVVKIFTKV